MLRLLHIDNYKIHKHLRLELGNLTVLTGLNSSGKSSVIQSLLLLRQSYQQNVLNEGLSLNGDLLSIGLCRDALCQMADEDYMSFGIDGGHGLSTWRWMLRMGFWVKTSFLYCRDLIRKCCRRVRYLRTIFSISVRLVRSLQSPTP